MKKTVVKNSLVKNLVVKSTTPTFHIYQEDEEPPPPESLEGVVLVPSLEYGDVGHGVVHGPGPGGDPVAQQHIYAVVTMAEEKSTDTGQEEAEGEPVEQGELLWTVCKESLEFKIIQTSLSYTP